MKATPTVCNTFAGIRCRCLFFAQLEFNGTIGYILLDIIAERTKSYIAIRLLNFLEQIVGKKTVPFFRITLCGLVSLCCREYNHISATQRCFFDIHFHTA